MREDVAPFQDRQQIRFIRPMHHDRQARGIGCLPGFLQHLHVVRQLVMNAVDAHFDREDPIAMLVDDTNGRCGIDQRHVEVQLVAVIPDDRDIQHRVDAKRRRVDDELSKAEEGVGAGRSRVDGRRDAGWKSDRIRIHRNGIPVPVEVRVHVDQPGGHQLAASVEHLASPGGRNVRRDGGDLSVRDGDIALAGQLLRGVDDAAALDQQIVGSRRLAGGRRRRGQVGADANRGGARVPEGQPQRPQACQETRGDSSVTCQASTNDGAVQPGIAHRSTRGPGALASDQKSKLALIL